MTARIEEQRTKAQAAIDHLLSVDAGALADLDEDLRDAVLRKLEAVLEKRRNAPLRNSAEDVIREAADLLGNEGFNAMACQLRKTLPLEQKAGSPTAEAYTLILTQGVHTVLPDGARAIKAAIERGDPFVEVELDFFGNSKCATRTTIVTAHVVGLAETTRLGEEPTSTTRERHLSILR